MDFNKLTTDDNVRMSEHRKSSASLHVMVPDAMRDTSNAQARDPEQSHVAARGVVPEPMDVDHREGSQVLNIPSPPEAAVRTRCYKLNLDSEIVGITGKQHSHQLFLGPFAEPPPHLTYSNSDDSATTNSATTVAIQTAQIFRGITVGKDGTILSQNARATRSSRGSKTKKGEKSRQAAKIDKAKDLVEESVLGSKNTDEPANMVSLVIVGAYDDMKQLVRDGSKKLREAEGLPDEALFSINRHRVSSSGLSSPSSPMHRTSSAHSQNQRIPPTHVSSSSKRGSSMQTSPEKSRSQSLPQSTPPKIKSNPRDRTKSRRHSEEKSRRGFVADSCHDMLDNSHHGNIDGDWRDALGFSKGFHSIWNCGGTEEGGTVSPTQVCSPKEGKSQAMEMGSSPHQNPVYEGRDTALGYGREGESSRRAN